MSVKDLGDGSFSVNGDSITAYRVRVIYKGLQLKKTGLNPSSRVNILEAARSLGFKGRTCDALMSDMRSKYPELK